MKSIFFTAILAVGLDFSRNPTLNSISSQKSDLEVKQILSTKFNLNSNCITKCTNNGQLLVELNNLGFYPNKKSRANLQVQIINSNIVVSIPVYHTFLITNNYNITNYSTVVIKHVIKPN